MRILKHLTYIILSLTALLLLNISGFSQDTLTITSSSEITILNDSVFLNGSIVDKTNISSSILNNGYLSITGDIVNSSNTSLVFFPTTNHGEVHFVGDSVQRISGNNVQFNKVYIEKMGDTLYLDTLVIQNDSLYFNGGIINLNGNNLLLNNADAAYKGRMGPESDSSHIMGSAGYVYTDASISHFSNNAGYGMGIEFPNNTNTGNIRVERNHTPETTVTDGSINKYFNIKPSISGDYEVVVHYLDSTDIWDVNGTESDFKLWSSYTNGYYYEYKYGEVDTINNLVATNGDTITIQNPTRITVADHICDVTPIVDIGDTIHICNGSSTTINAENNGCFYSWSTGATTQIITVSTAETFIVTVTDPRGCFTVDTVITILDSIPDTEFTFNSAVGPCPGTIINFNNTTTIAPEAEPLTYLWQFGDGHTSTEENPQYSYVSSGSYTITLTAYAANSCAKSFSDNVNVFSLPYMSLTVNNACLNDPVIFTNTTPNTVPALTHWDLGNGVEVNANNTVYNYSTYGTFPVQLTVTNNFGCVDSITQNVEVYPLPVAAFTSDDAEVCLQNSSVFHNTSTIPYGSLTYQWDFGNGYSNTTPNPIIVYDVHDTYLVRLIALSEYGCSDKDSAYVTIRPLPNASFSFNHVCEGDTVYFVNESTIDPAEMLTYSWTFGDGTSSTSTNPYKLYDNPGSYTVNLEVTSEYGCSESIQKTVYVYANPSTNFICQPVCYGTNSVFQNVSLPSDGSLSFQWDFGDENTSNISNPQHYYNSDGTYEVELIAESGQGCSDTIIKDIIVYPTPVVDFGPDIYHCFDTYVLDALNPGANYLWSNNAGSQTITVTQDGDYSVTITNNFGCSDSDEVNVTLNAPIVINFDGESLEVCDSITLDAGYPGAEYLWSTGATTQSILVTTSDTYSVSITNQGCPGEGTADVVVYESPQLDLGDIITECAGIPVSLDAENAGSDYIWSTSETFQQIEVILAGTYSVTVTDQHSCTVSDSVQVVFNSLPVDPFPSDTIICGSGVLDAQNAGAQYEWIDGSNSQFFNVSQSGVYWVNIIGGNSCSISDTVDVTVNPKPIVNMGNDTALCEGDILVLDAENFNSTYLWNNNQTSQLIDVVESGNYSVQVTNEYGCSAIDSILLQFNPNPNVNLGSDLYLCSNQLGLLDAGNDGVDYSWGSDFGFSSSENPVMVADSGKYWVDVVNEFGCFASDTVKVQYSQLSLTAYFLAASQAMRGDTVRFVDVSYPDPINYLWNFKDGVTSTDAIPEHVFYMEGTYWVELMVSNNYCSDTISKSIDIIGTSKNYIPPDVEVADTEDLFEIISENLYPNPNEGVFTYELQLNQHTSVSLSLFDLNGKMIYQEQIDNASYINKVFNFNGLVPGMYVLRMHVHNKLKTYKIVIM